MGIEQLVQALAKTDGGVETFAADLLEFVDDDSEEALASSFDFALDVGLLTAQRARSVIACLEGAGIRVFAGAEHERLVEAARRLESSVQTRESSQESAIDAVRHVRQQMIGVVDDIQQCRNERARFAEQRIPALKNAIHAADDVLREGIDGDV